MKFATLCIVLLACAGALPAQTPLGSEWNYQGHLILSGVAVDEPADFLFSLFDVSVGGSPLASTSPQGVAVNAGVFDVQLDFGFNVFDGNKRWMEIYVRVPAGSGGYQLLSPRQPISAVPYAMYALDGGGSGGGGLWTQTPTGITNLTPGEFVGINRSTKVTSAEYFGIQAPVSGASYGGMYIRTDGAEGKPFYGYSTPAGSAWTYFNGSDLSLRIFNSGDRIVVLNNGNVGIGATAPTSRLQAAGVIHSSVGGFKFPDGSIQTTAATGGGGGNDGDWTINGNDMYMTPSGKLAIGTTTPATGAKLTIVEAGAAAIARVHINGGLSGGLELRGGAARLDIAATFDEAVVSTGTDQSLSLNSGGALFLQSGTADPLQLRTSNHRWAQVDGSGLTQFFHTNNNATVAIDGEDPNSGGGQIELFKSDGSRTVVLNGATSGGGQGGTLSLYTDGNLVTPTVVLDGEYGGTAGGALVLRNSSGQTGIELVADLTPNEQPEIWMYKPNGTRTIEIEAEETGDPSQGATIKLFNDLGELTLELDADHGASNKGRVITGSLQITGGSDLSEQFDVAAAGVHPEPGSVVSIDPASPGDLRVSTAAYDRRVAGIISGAGGIQTGMMMGQQGSEADGGHPVALTGRVYCKVDASYGAIEPGDLLTTSDTPGHAMKVTEHDRAVGAILGKAMTGLASGRGEVLVLVSLQ